MESTAATAVEAAAGHCVTAVATAYVTAVAAATITRSPIAITAASVPVAVAAAIAVHAAVSISVAAIPGASPDKDAAIEPPRSVIPVRRTSIGIITVVAIGADRSRVTIAITPVHRSTDPDANRHLSMGIGRRRE
jgi:hypothetical protein